MNSNKSSAYQHDPTPGALSSAGCILVLVCAFLGWMFSGVHMAINALAMRNASVDLLQPEFVKLGIAAGTDAAEAGNVPETTLKYFDADGDQRLDAREKEKAREGRIGQWFGWLVSAFLLGAASGGYLFGWIGDRIGRAKAMALCILCYSVFSAATVGVQQPWQLWVLRFVTCMGVGGMWPNGIALVSEAWPNISRPVLAGAIGTAANLGIMMMALITIQYVVTTDNWRWLMWFGATPVVLGLFVWLAVPESPRWLAVASRSKDAKQPTTGLGDIFRPPILRTTLVGIALGTIPLFGGWGSSNWVNAWAGQVGDKPDSEQVSADDAANTTDSAQDTAEHGPAVDDVQRHPNVERYSTKRNPALKAWTVFARSAPGTLSSLLGGALAMWLGRRKCYFLLSLLALASAQILFWFNEPGSPWFLFWTGCLGFFSGFYFGWLPLCLPEMFPTRVRSTGAGVSFNWGRILTAFGVLVAAGLLNNVFEGDYASIGKITSFIYAFGMVVILFAPDTSKATLDD